MDEWVATVRDLKDHAEDAYEVESICRDIIYYMQTKTIPRSEAGKFRQRIGPAYEAFIKSLHRHDETLVEQIVNDDAFWEATLKTNTLHRTV
jgi:hypothetical protein